MARPTKAQLKQRKQAARAERRAVRAVTYDPDAPDHGWVVCDKCGFHQPTGYESCVRGRVLGPTLECDSVYAHTAESYLEEAA